MLRYIYEFNPPHEEPPQSNPEVPTPEAAVRIIGWRDAATQVGELVAGDVISGFQDNALDELDIFADNVGSFLSGHRPNLTLPAMRLTSKGREHYIGWHQGSRPPSQVVRPKGFHGQLRGMTAVMLDDAWVNDHKRRTTHFPGKGFVILADMYSTGRGVVGRVAKQCTIGTTVLQLGEKIVPGYTTAAYRNLPAHSAEAATEALLLEANHTSYQIVSRGLRRVILGGLPGLGREK